MEKSGLEASGSIACGCHICSILTTSNEDLQMCVTTHCHGVTIVLPPTPGRASSCTLHINRKDR